MIDTTDRTDDPWGTWKGRIGAARRRREDNVGDWQTNVNKRKGRDVRARSAEDTSVKAASGTVHVNKDWPLTKAKIALLYSQTPEIRASSTDPQAAQALPIFAQDLNRQFRKSNVGATIEEELADVINASGIAACLLSCEKRTQTVDMPQFDPMVAGMSGMENPAVPVVRTTDIRYPARRLSPASLLIPADFTGSVYDDARWLGYEDSLPWVVAKPMFGLQDEDKDEVCGKDRKANITNTLNTDASTSYQDNDTVTYQELFYWRHFYHEDETNYHALHRLVFVDGKDEPAIDEEYTGQQRMPDGSVVGVLRNPIQVLTLTYVSDDPFPPSDSTVSRGAVSEMEESREQKMQQRKHSLPVRWGDTNRIGANARAKIDRGEWQDFIWTNGPGERAIGEVSRAAYPPENYELEHVIDQEITDQWTVGPNQAGSFNKGERSAREASIVEKNFNTRIGLERAKVERHFLAIAEVLGGLMALHGATQIPPEVLPGITYSINVDSTVLLDADTQIERLMRGLNLTAQSGFVNPKPIITKIWALLGENPNEIMIDPQPKPPEAVKVSVSKAEDLINPIFLATLMHTQQAPTPEDMAAAIKLLNSAQVAAAGMGLSIVPTEAVDPNAPPADVKRPEPAHSNWDTAGRIDRRSEDGGA